MADTTQEIMNKTAVKEKIAEVSRELLTLKVTVPLGDPKFKEIHTNSYIWLPILDYMEVENYEQIIREIVNISHATRNVGYKRDRWYVEGVTIKNDSGKFEMELTLNPLASANQPYLKKFTGFTKAWTDATSSTSSSSTSTSTVKSTSENSSLKGGQGTTIDNKVKEICGNETDQLKKAKLIHEWLRTNVNYKRYCCCKYANAPEKAYNNRRSLNCGDTAILTCSMMKSAGLNAYIVHRTYNGGHFWCIIEINGKKYASDQTGDGSAWNTVWSYSGRSNTSISSYSHKESGLSCGCEAYGC